MKMDNASTYGLRLDQMADLFALGAEGFDPAAERADDRTLQTLLGEQLTSAEPKGSLVRDTLVMMVGAPDHLVGKPLAVIFLEGESDLGLLREIKNASKALSCSLDSATETALARTIYFAAIAAALVHHDIRISQSTYETLAESLTMLIEKPWIVPELAELFSRARDICRDRQDTA